MLLKNTLLFSSPVILSDIRTGSKTIKNNGSLGVIDGKIEA
jgi:hypothetical protein